MGLTARSAPVWPTHLVHVEPQGHQRDPETALGPPQVGCGGHMQCFDGELGAEGKLWEPAGPQAPAPTLYPAPPVLHCTRWSLSWACLSPSILPGSHPLLCGHTRPCPRRQVGAAGTMLEWARRGIRSLVCRYRNLLIWEEASRSRTSSSCTMNTWRDRGRSSSSWPGAAGPVAGSTGYTSCWKLTCGADGRLSRGGRAPPLPAPLLPQPPPAPHLAASPQLSHSQFKLHLAC